MKPSAKILFLIALLAISIAAQTETLTNPIVIEMSKVGLDKEVILKKITDSPNNFDVSVNALIELKKANVADEVIALMLERAQTRRSRKARAKPLLEDFRKASQTSKQSSFRKLRCRARKMLC